MKIKCKAIQIFVIVIYLFPNYINSQTNLKLGLRITYKVNQIPASTNQFLQLEHFNSKQIDLHILKRLKNKISFGAGIGVNYFGINERDYNIWFSSDIDPSTLNVDPYKSFYSDNFIIYQINAPVTFHLDVLDKFLYINLQINNYITFRQSKKTILNESGLSIREVESNPLRNNIKYMPSINTGIGIKLVINKVYPFVEIDYEYSLRKRFEEITNSQQMQDNYKLNSFNIRIGIRYNLH